MNLEEALQGLKRLAAKDKNIRNALLATRTAEKPAAEFCKLSARYGFPVYEMDLVMAGEEYYAAMRRSTEAARILRFLRERMITMSSSSPNWKHLREFHPVHPSR